MGAFVCAYLGSLLHLPGMDNNVYLQTGVIIYVKGQVSDILYRVKRLFKGLQPPIRR
jgi:hypothetical protein